MLRCDLGLPRHTRSNNHKINSQLVVPLRLGAGWTHGMGMQKHIDKDAKLYVVVAEQVHSKLRTRREAAGAKALAKYSPKQTVNCKP